MTPAFMPASMHRVAGALVVAMLVTSGCVREQTLARARERCLESNATVVAQHTLARLRALLPEPSGYTLVYNEGRYLNVLSLDELGSARSTPQRIGASKQFPDAQVVAVLNVTVPNVTVPNVTVPNGYRVVFSRDSEDISQLFSGQLSDRIPEEGDSALVDVAQLTFASEDARNPLVLADEALGSWIAWRADSAVMLGSWTDDSLQTVTSFEVEASDVELLAFALDAGIVIFVRDGEDLALHHYDPTSGASTTDRWSVGPMLRSSEGTTLAALTRGPEPSVVWYSGAAFEVRRVEGGRVQDSVASIPYTKAPLHLAAAMLSARQTSLALVATDGTVELARVGEEKTTVVAAAGGLQTRASALGSGTLLAAELRDSRRVELRRVCENE